MLSKSFRSTIKSALVLGLAILWLTAHPSSALAQSITIEDEAAAKAEPDKLADAAGQLIEGGMLDQAEELLDKAEEFGATLNRLRFLRAEIARRRGDLPGAVELYRAILLEEPDALRVRLELGRTYYFLEDDEKAELQFRYALAGDLPEPVVENVLIFLDRIRARRVWAFNFNFALAPDSNVNAATNDREIEIGGLPFTLSEDARESSGIGVEMRMGGRFDVPINNQLRLRQRASYRVLEYEGGEFDDQTISLSGGPVYRFGRNEVSATVLFSRRYFAGRDYNRTYGVRGDVSRRLTDRVEAAIGAQLFQADHDEVTSLDGPRGEVSLSGIFALTPQSFLRGVTAVNREKADDATQSNWSLFTALGYFVELPLGFNVYAEPGVVVRRFDEKDGFFDERREEITARFEVNLRNRRFDFYGFTPLIGSTLEKRFSSIDIYDFERARFTLGVTREF